MHAVCSAYVVCVTFDRYILRVVIHCAYIHNMGGKQKQGANRVKNNARPSSSSKSINVLGNTPSFSGFYSKDGIIMAVLPGLSNNTNDEQLHYDNITPDFILVFKKMSKKDTTTKLKALNEFSSLVQSSSEQNVQDTLVMWPRIYILLTNDIEHRVRESIQSAHGILVSKCGKHIAPYLKQIIPIWLISQYDTYVPAALQAQNSLQKVFPSKKLPEVMAFCRIEILSYIRENLIEHTATTLTNPKLNTPEECEAKYERMMIASLLGYSLFINQLPESHIEWLCTEQEKILDNNKFWAFGKHKVNQIRAAWYAVVGSLCQRLSLWFSEKYGKKAITLVLNQFNEKDSTITPQMWENAILLMSNIKDWWNYTESNKNILSGIFLTLKSGGWGSAEHIAPLMLPLLAQLSTATLDEESYDEFFVSILRGLQNKSIISSKTECSAWLKGLAECLKYVSINGKDNVPQLISKTLREWINEVARPHALSINPYTPLKLSTVHLSELSFFWTKNSCDSKNENSAKYSTLTRLFWQNILFIITAQIDKLEPEDEIIKQTTDAHRELLLGLKNHLCSKTKRASRVKFQNDEINIDENSGKTSIIKCNDSFSGENNVKQCYERELNNIVYNICNKYLEYAKNKNVSSPILTPLNSLILEFDKIELFQQLMHTVNKNTDAKLIQFYSEFLNDWITGSMRSQAVVDLTFSLFNHLSNDDQKDVLRSFDQLPTAIIKWCICRCLSYPFSTYESVQEWLYSNSVHESLIALCKDVVKQGDRGHATLLKMCFAQNNNGDIMISKESCSAIIQILTESLSITDSIHLDMCASFASQLISTICFDQIPDDFQTLLISLFRLDCMGPCDTLSNDTKWEVNTSWQDVLSSTDIHQIKSFTTKAMDIVYEKLYTNDVNSMNIDDFVNLTNNIAMSATANESTPQMKLEIFQQIAPIIFRFDSEILHTFFDTAHKTAIISDIMKHRIFISPIKNHSNLLKTLIDNVQNKACDELNKNHITVLLKWICFGIKVFDKILFTLCSQTNDNDNDEDSDNSKENTPALPEFVFSESCQEMFSFLLFKVTVLNTLFKEYQAWWWHSLVDEYYSVIKKTLICSLKLLSDEQHNMIIKLIESKESCDEFYWSVCLKYYCDLLKIVNEDFSHNTHYANINQSDNPLLTIAVSPIYSNKLSSTEDNTQVKTTKEYILGLVALSSIHLICAKHDDLKQTTILSEQLTSPNTTLLLIVDEYYKNKDIMLYDMDFSSTSWEKVECNAVIVNFLVTAVKSVGWTLDRPHWDFINITLSSLLQSLDKTKREWNTMKFSLLACSVFDLYNVVRNFIKDIPLECTRKLPSDCIVSLPQEWKEVFINDITQRLMNIFLSICGDCSSLTTVTSKDSFLISSLHETMNNYEWSCYQNSVSQSELIQKIGDIIEKCLNIISNPVHHSLKYLCHNVFRDMTPLLVKTDDVPNDKNEMPIQHFSIHKIMPSIIHLQEYVEIILSPYQINESSCILLPHTDSFSLVVGYILLWDRILEFVRLSIPYLQHQYAELFKTEKYIEKLVETLFRVLPDEIKPNKPVTNYFETTPKLSSSAVLRSELIGELSCICLVDCLKCAPAAALVRGWWGSLPSKTSQYVEQVIRVHLSPEVVKFLLKEVTNHSPTNRRDFQIIVHWSSNEILCVYKYEDTRMDLVVTLGPVFPLCIPHVVTTSTCSQNVAWLAMFLSYQNSSLWQVANLWLNSIERKLDAASECYICYSKLHAQTGELAKDLCKTCKNKFHQTCLFRWFRTSHTTTCPLCRCKF